MDEYQNQINEFLTYCKLSKNLGEKTILSYRSDLNSYFFYLCDNPNGNVMDYISRLTSTRHKCSTIKRHLASLNQFFKYIYRNDRLSNPMLKYEFKLNGLGNVITSLKNPIVSVMILVIGILICYLINLRKVW